MISVMMIKNNEINNKGCIYRRLVKTASTIRYVLKLAKTETKIKTLKTFPLLEIKYFNVIWNNINVK